MVSENRWVRPCRDGSTRPLLVIDQFEELFTMTEPDVAERFLESSLDAIDDPGRTSPVSSRRYAADFYDRPLASPSFGARFADNVLNVVSLSPDELEAAATLPARRVDVELEPRLIGTSHRRRCWAAERPAAVPVCPDRGVRRTHVADTGSADL